MIIYNEQNEETEIKCPCGALSFTFDHVGYTQGLTCDGCKTFRTVEQWIKLTEKEDIFSKSRGLWE